MMNGLGGSRLRAALALDRHSQFNTVPQKTMPRNPGASFVTSAKPRFVTACKGGPFSLLNKTAPTEPELAPPPERFAPED